MEDARSLHCREFVELVTDYLEHALPLPEAVRFEAHRLLCPGCARYLEQVQQTVRWLGQVRRDAVAPATRGNLLAAFRSWQRAAVS